MEMNYLVMNRVLSPIQSALFVVEAYPTRPDALALSNIAAQVRVRHWITLDYSRKYRSCIPHVNLFAIENIVSFIGFICGLSRGMYPPATQP